MFRALKWKDWVGAGLGAWLLASPWVLGFSSHETATMNALVVGTILMLEELLELGLHEGTERWIDLLAGIWLIASPAVFRFDSVPAALNAVAVGTLTILLAFIAILQTNRADPTAGQP